MKVEDPRGQTWRVTRRWVPWRRRLGDLDGGPNVPVLGDDPISMIVGLVMLVVLLPFLVLALLAFLELLLLLAVLPFALLGRVLLGRHWMVEARRGFTAVWEQEAGGWAASRARIHEVAEHLRLGYGTPAEGRRLEI